MKGTVNNVIKRLFPGRAPEKIQIITGDKKEWRDFLPGDIKIRWYLLAENSRTVFSGEALVRKGAVVKISTEADRNLSPKLEKEMYEKRTAILKAIEFYMAE